MAGTTVTHRRTARGRVNEGRESVCGVFECFGTGETEGEGEVRPEAGVGERVGVGMIAASATSDGSVNTSANGRAIMHGYSHGWMVGEG